MKRIIFLPILILIGYFAYTKSVGTPPLTSYVNPFVGTGGHGHTFPGATVPFGMVQLSPDTRIDGSWDGCSGYHISDSTIYGFSHTHLSGTGCSDYGDIMLMPTIGKALVCNTNYYSSTFSHKTETATPGYYSVKLDKGIDVELTATTRVGFHKYTFTKAGESNIVIDLTHRDKLIDGEIIKINDTTLKVFRRSEAWAKDQWIYAYIVFSKKIKSFTSFTEPLVEDKLAGEISLRSNHVKAAFKFDLQKNEPLLVKVAISTVSYNGAKNNMLAELPSWDFDKTKKDAETLWNKELGKIEISTEDKDKTKTFYTALYHTMIQPNVAMDVDGMYRGRDNKIHKAVGFTYYSVFSLWDTFRAAHPLYTIIDRKRTTDFIKTFLAQYQQGGRLPVWELASNETDCMIGYHSVSVIADAATKGITDFDMNLALEAMEKSATWNHLGLPAYIDHGYLALEDESESVSKTLEYAYDDWCIAQMAKLLNKKDDEAIYEKRSQSWKNVFDKETGFMRPRKNGGCLTPFETREVNNNYTEGNSWQYTFFVPQDIPGLIAMMGGQAQFEKKLDELFSTSNKTTGRDQPDISGLIGQYAHGNEPSHHMAYLYNYTMHPSKTQQRVHQILTDFYKPLPDGLIGNEDCGQMSAWYVLSALGIYEVTPGSANYQFGTPIYKESKTHLDNGKTFSISAKGISKDNYYIQSSSIDGKENTNNFISYKDIMNGTTLAFNMGATAKANSKALSSASEDNHVPEIIIVPTIKAATRIFRDNMSVELKSNYPNYTLYYTIDGTTPSAKSTKYTTPIYIDKTTTVKTIVVNDKEEQSAVTSGTFYKMPHNWKINIKSKYNPQYTAGGDEGLIDGIRGDKDWQKGEWQGYQGQDFEAIIDLGKLESIHSFTAGFLQDTRSWILMPTKVEFYASTDNINFGLVSSVNNTVAPEDLTSQTKDFTSNLTKLVSAKYIKIKAINFGKLPQWHQGFGGDAFIFIDEINIK